MSTVIYPFTQLKIELNEFIFTKNVIKKFLHDDNRTIKAHFHWDCSFSHVMDFSVGVED